MKKPEIIDVNAGNVEREGFFCFMSKRKNPGWRAKLEWLKKRFPEGLRLKLLKLPERGFIEYAPGEWCWRPVETKGYMVVHCLWVVGRSRGRGNATVLLHECIEDAKRSKMKGMAMVANDSAYMRWKGFLAKRGFEPVDRAPGGYELMCLRFGKAAWPKFSGGWERKAKACGQGVAILRTRQCPYYDDATASLLETAGQWLDEKNA